VDCCEHGYETSNSAKGGEFLDQLLNCQLPYKDSAPMELVISVAVRCVATSTTVCSVKDLNKCYASVLHYSP
jgi:hypothetical protein